MARITPRAAMSTLREPVRDETRCASGDERTRRVAVSADAAAAARGDQLLVCSSLIAIWQVLSLTLGTYWVGSPWGVLTRFVAASSTAICCATPSYTLSRSGARASSSARCRRSRCRSRCAACRS